MSWAMSPLIVPGAAFLIPSSVWLLRTYMMRIPRELDEAAMIESLQDGKIAGAGLDVLEEEPTRDDNPLLDMDNVVVTPHMSSSTPEAGKKSLAFAAMNAARVASGGEPQSVVPVD